MAEEDIGEVEVRNWLKSIKLAKYADAFLEAGFDDLEVLAHLTEADLDALPLALPLGHRKKILLKARDLGSATLRGQYANGEYVPPAKSMITSQQLAELKYAEKLAKAKAAASGALSPAAATEMKLLLKTEVLQDLKKEGFDVDASLADAQTALEEARAETANEDETTEETTDGDSPGVKKRPSSGKKKKKKGTTLKKSTIDGKKTKRKKAIEKKKARQAAAKLTRKTRDDSAFDMGTSKKSSKRSSTLGSDGSAMAIAAKLAAESGKPVPVKVYLAQRPDEPLIFSIYHHNTANELVQLAARTLDVSPADFILRQVGPGNRSERLEPSEQPLMLVAKLGADAHLYRFELAARSKTFVRFYDALDSAKFYTLEVDGDTEAGDVADEIADKQSVSPDSIVLIATIGDRKRELEEYEFVRDIMDKANKRGSEVTFSVADRNSLADILGGGGGADDDLDDTVDTVGALNRNESLTAGIGGSSDLPHGPFWNAMGGGAAGGLAAGGEARGKPAENSGVQAITVQHDGSTEQWALSLRKSLREQLGSLAAKFNIADVHNYDFYFVGAEDVPAKTPVSRDSLRPSQKLNINVPVSDASANDRLVLVAKNRSSQIGAAPPSGLQKFAAAAVDAASPTRSASTTATPNANANGSSTFKRATPTAQRQAQANAKSGRRLSGAPQEPAPSPHAQRRSQIESEDESTEEADAHVGANIAQKRRSILKAFSGGAESDMTSDSGSSKKEVSFGRQHTAT